MDNFCFLSHPMGRYVPAYGNERREITIRLTKSIHKGDICNTYLLAMENHLGTHIDAPAHFFTEGAKISDYSADYWVFDKPFVFDIELKENEIIRIEDISSLPQNADLVLIKSRFQCLRGEKKYSFNNPGVGPEAGLWIRKERPSVRAIGFDFLSLSPYQDKELGHQAHLAFLNPDSIGHPVLIIEDMDLSADLRGLKQVWAVPLRIESIDSSPCTVIGVF